MNFRRCPFDSVAPLLALGLAAAGAAGCAPDEMMLGFYAPPDEPEAGAPATAPATTSEPGASSSTARLDASAGDATAAGSPGSCDLTGRWLVTDREVATAIGSVEASHTWFYYELTQTGSQVTVSKGLDCGGNVLGISAVAANTSYQKTFAAMMANDVDTGRKGTSAPTSAGCDVAFAQHTIVVSASVPFYDDASQTLPSASQEATSSAPGWEDWDQDGNPGYTMNVTGLVTGQVYVVTRNLAAWSGSVASVDSTFTIADDWSSETSLLGINGPSLLESATSSVKDSDASMHFASFARLAATQATGSDADICTSVRSLAPTLTPTANN